jgi:hypothetical protein
MRGMSSAQATDQEQTVHSLIEQLQHAEDAAKELSDHNLKSWVMDCIENALKALRRDY